MCSVASQRVEYASVGGTLRGWISAQREERFPGVTGQGWNVPFCRGTCQGKAGQTSAGIK